MRNVSDKVVGKIKTHILCSTFFPENRAAEKYGRASQATGDNI
jgi:hypothetical protein